MESVSEGTTDDKKCLEPNYKCPDRVTCLLPAQVCDGQYDCPRSELGPGGEEEDDCPGSGKYNSDNDGIEEDNIKDSDLDKEDPRNILEHSEESPERPERKEERDRETA